MIGDKIKLLRNKANLTQEELGNKIGVSASTIGMYEQGRRSPDGEKTICLATVFNVSTDYLLGREEAQPIQSNISMIYDKVYQIPVYESVSAGLGALADDHIVDYEPLYIDNPSEVSETFCLRVKGDSMFPKIEDGDIIQVLKTTSVDSGSIAVILIDGEEGVVKKVNYGPDWIELVSINPMYPPRMFEGPEVQRLRVAGLVKRIIKPV